MMEESGDDSPEASSSEDIKVLQENPTAQNLKDSNNPPKRKWSTLLLHASIMCGREFLYAVEIVLVTPIILQLGMPEKFYSFMWCFSPIIGILIGPVIGSRSDRCTSRFGRRRPYIVILVVGAVVGLTLLIYSKDIASILGGPTEESQRLWGVIVGIVGAQTMDFCLDQTETPLRAYTLDVCSSDDQQRAFALQTVFIGIGGALGFIVDGIDWENTVISSLFGSQIKVVYVFAVLAYVITTMCNLFSIKEVVWVNRKSSPRVTPEKHVVKSKINFVRKSKSFQTTSCTESATQTSSEDCKQCENSPVCLAPNPVSPQVALCEEDENNQVIPRKKICRRRPVSLLARISMSKSLYLSTSCPGGLDEYGLQKDDESLSSQQSGHDSEFDEDLNLQSVSSNEFKCEDTSFSLPTLNDKKMESMSHGRSLLDYIRSKEFSIRAFKSKTKSEGSVLSANNAENSGETAKSLLQKQDFRTNTVNNNLDEPITASEALCNSTNDIPSNNNITNFNKSLPRSNSTKTKNHGNHQSNGNIPIKKGRTEQGKTEHDQDHVVSLRQLWLSVVTMPSQLKWLCVVQLLGFVGMETVLLWYTDLMGRIVYGGDPQGASNSTELAQYNAGVKMGCWGLTIYSIAMILFSVFMDRLRLLTRFRIRSIYSFAFLLMALAMVIMFFFTNKWVILVLSWCIGVTFCIMLTVPYVLVGKYHLNNKYVRKSPGDSRRGFGLDCAILACQMYAGNILSATISSPVIYLFDTVKAMLLLTGTCHLLALIFAYFFVTYSEYEKSLWEISSCRKPNTFEKSTETVSI